MKQNREPINKGSLVICGQLIYGKEAKNIHQGKDVLSNNQCWENWTAMFKKNKIRLPSYTIYKNQFKMDKRLILRTETIKLLEENIGSTL